MTKLCPICGYNIEKTNLDILYNSGCPNCKSKLFTSQTFKQEKASRKIEQLNKNMVPIVEKIEPNLFVNERKAR